INPKNVIIIVAKTSAVSTNRRFLEKTENTSPNRPNKGNIKIYTSGRPNIQNKSCQHIELPPQPTLKTEEANIRSNINKNRFTVKGGKANKTNTLVINVAHANKGIRI